MYYYTQKHAQLTTETEVCLEYYESSNHALLLFLFCQILLTFCNSALAVKLHKARVRYNQHWDIISLDNNFSNSHSRSRFFVLFFLFFGFFVFFFFFAFSRADYDQKIIQKYSRCFRPLFLKSSGIFIPAVFTAIFQK